MVEERACIFGGFTLSCLDSSIEFGDIDIALQLEKAYIPMVANDHPDNGKITPFESFLKRYCRLDVKIKNTDQRYIESRSEMSHDVIQVSTFQIRDTKIQLVKTRICPLQVISRADFGCTKSFFDGRRFYHKY
jgi:hypothetical protein